MNRVARVTDDVIADLCRFVYNIKADFTACAADVDYRVIIFINGYYFSGKTYTLKISLLINIQFQYL